MGFDVDACVQVEALVRDDVEALARWRLRSEGRLVVVLTVVTLAHGDEVASLHPCGHHPHSDGGAGDDGLRGEAGRPRFLPHVRAQRGRRNQMLGQQPERRAW